MTQYSTHPQKIKIRDDDEDVLEINADGSINVLGPLTDAELRASSVLVGIGDGANLDAFSRLRVSNPVTLFDSSFIYDLQPIIYQALTANGGTITHSAVNASAILSLDGTAGGSAILQSKSYHRYIPGKSQLVLLTGVVGAAVAGVTKRGGYFDANDGLFFEQNGTTDTAIVRRTSTSGSPVDNRVVQANWNLDPLDGTGPSGITFDPTKAYIAVIDFQWLGMGRVRFGFDLDGQIVYCHEFLNANVLTTVYMRRGSLPIRWSISGDTAASMQATCASVQSEGGNETHLTYQFAYDRAAVTAADGVQTHGFSIRPKATFNSITNRMKIQPTEFTCQNLGASPVLVEVYYGTTVGGSPSWGDMDATYSGLQVDTAGTPSGGIRVASFWAPANSNQSKAAPGGSSFSSRFPLTLDIAGTDYTNITIWVTGQGGSSSCRPGLMWEEDR